MISIVTPAHNEQANLPLLYAQLQEALEPLGLEWEWILVDDHSSDATLEVFRKLALGDARLRGFRLSRNFGSHRALLCGLRECKGRAAVVLAADLQDPPSLIPSLVEQWRQGVQLCWAVRAQAPSLSSRIFYRLMTSFVGLHGMPRAGADFFLADVRVLDALRQFRESNVNLFALLCSMGFRQGQIEYHKEARQHGRSSWTFAKKLKLLIDSVLAFTYLPIRLMMAFGVLVGCGGFLYANLVVYNYIQGSPTPGWSSLMVVVLLLGGSQMVMLGLLGEYLWRCLDESRQRPHYLVEQVVLGGSQASDE